MRRFLLSWNTEAAPIAEVILSNKMMPLYSILHIIPKKGKGVQSRLEANFAYKGKFVVINTSRFECDLTHQVIQKMHYEGESQSWSWDKQCAKFHRQLHVINEWAVTGMATHMSNEF